MHSGVLTVLVDDVLRELSLKALFVYIGGISR